MQMISRPLRVALASLPLLVAACGGGDGLDAARDGGAGAPSPSAAPSPGFTLTVGPAALAVGQGQDAWLEITIARDAGFADAVRVTLAPETGVSADPLVLSPSQDRVMLPVRVATELATGSVHRLAITATGPLVGQSAASQLTVIAPQPSGQALIAAARAAGTLDDGTALLYRAYALIGDKRLPDAFFGSGSLDEDNALFVEIRRRIASLPAAQRDALQPFIVRPADPRSVWNSAASASGTRVTAQGPHPLAISPAVCPTGPAAAGVWISKRSTSHAVRVWAQCTAVAAENADALTLIDAGLVVLDKVHAPMTSLMGTPLPDLDGGDDAIDFYLVNDGNSVFRRGGNWRPIGLGTTYDDEAAGPVAGSHANSAFVTLTRSVAYGPRFHTTLIHEFFHVLQKAHNADFSVTPTGTLHWFAEASAAWASAHFDRTEAPWPDGRGAWIDAHRRFKQYFLPSSSDALNSSGSPHDYSAYIWPYFVEQETGDARFMGRIWSSLNSVTTFAEADQAIDRVYSFATSFKRFALRNLNSEFLPGDPLPRAKRYVALDPEQFTDDNSPPPGIVTGTLVADRPYLQNLTLDNLSARYLRLDVAGDVTPPVRKIRIDTTLLQAAGTVDIQALLLTQNGWLPQPIDITDNVATFCFDAGPATVGVRGSFQQIVLVVSNHAVAPGMSAVGDVKIDPSSQPCATVWDGTVDMTSTVESSNPGGGATFTYTITTQLTFELDPNSTATPRPFRLRAGSYVYREVRDVVDIGSCHSVVTAAGPLHRALSTADRSDGAATGTLSTYESPADPLPQYVLGESIEDFTAFGTTTTVADCTFSGKSTTTQPEQSIFLWQMHGHYDITAGGTEMKSTYTYDNGGGTTTYNWLLTKKLSE
jgi:hypothetical protein